MSWRLARCVLFAFALGNCGGDPDSESSSEAALAALTDPSRPLPDKLSEVGIYPDLDVERPSPRALPYRPRSELWSNGLHKKRLLLLPEGKRIDAAGERWRFPKGTLLFKTFSDEEGPVETRVLRQVGAKFEYAVYQWADGDATLLDGQRNVPLEVRTRAGRTPHTIPSTLTCRQCHESSQGQVLGLSALQGFDADLPDLDDAFESAPEPDDPLRGESAETKAVLDYFVGNCVHCHNGGVGLASSFDLHPDVALDNVILEPTDSSATATGVRVVPGSPEDSVLFRAVSGEGDTADVKNMPPEGVQVRDDEAVELLRRWIEGLE